MVTEKDNKEADLRLLQEIFFKGDMKAAKIRALQLIKKYRSANIYNILALAYKNLGDYAGALELLERLLKRNPENALFLGNLGNIYFDLGMLDKAELSLQKSLQINRNNYNVAVSLANLYAV